MIKLFVGKDGSRVTTVVATPGQGPDGTPLEVSYMDSKIIGNGSFGVVYQAKLCDTGEMVAIKKVLQDKRFKVSLSVLVLYFAYVPVITYGREKFPRYGKRRSLENMITRSAFIAISIKIRGELCNYLLLSFIFKEFRDSNSLRIGYIYIYIFFLLQRKVYTFFECRLFCCSLCTFIWPLSGKSVLLLKEDFQGRNWRKFAYKNFKKDISN